MLLNLEYATGFFDGEGSVGLYKKASNPSSFDFIVQMSVTNKEVVESFKESFGGFHNSRKYSRKDNKRKDQWCWSAYGKTAYNFLKAILPFSIVKREEIIVAIQYYEEMVIGKDWKRRAKKDQDDNRFIGTLPLDPSIVERRQWYSDKLKLIKREGMPHDTCE